MRQTPTVKIVVDVLDDAERLVELAGDAERDGHRMVRRLIADWQDGTNRFARPGECLYGAWLDGLLVGVCGLNVDPYVSDASVGRVRRLYVAADRRRLGIGSMLVQCVMDEARKSFALLRLRTRNPVAAAFYESHGFVPVSGEDACTHEYRLQV